MPTEEKIQSSKRKKIVIGAAIAVGAAALIVGGFLILSKFKSLEDEIDDLKDENEDLKDRLDESEDENESLRAELGASLLREGISKGGSILREIRTKKCA